MKIYSFFTQGTECMYRLWEIYLAFPLWRENPRWSGWAKAGYEYLYLRSC